LRVGSPEAASDLVLGEVQVQRVHEFLLQTWVESSSCVVAWLDRAGEITGFRA
jgi:hypothetical protein